MEAGVRHDCHRHHASNPSMAKAVAGNSAEEDERPSSHGKSRRKEIKRVRNQRKSRKRTRKTRRRRNQRNKRKRRRRRKSQRND